MSTKDLSNCLLIIDLTLHSMSHISLSSELNDYKQDRNPSYHFVPESLSINVGRLVEIYLCLHSLQSNCIVTFYYPYILVSYALKLL